MKLEDIRSIKDEAEQVNRIYDIFNEEKRLNHSRAAQVEFLTTVRYIEKYVKPGARILDIGAGAGEYSFYFAERGYEVNALELADANVRAFQKRLRPGLPLTLLQGNALDLSVYADESFDAVLVFGPLYHLHEEKDRRRCIEEAGRVCKKDGTLFFSFIAHDMVFMTELRYDGKYFSTGDYEHESFRLHDFPFVFFTVPEARQMLADSGIKLLREVASDGASELMAPEINAMDEEGWQQYLGYHFYRCEKPELLGMSNHLLFVGRKEKQTKRGIEGQRK